MELLAKLRFRAPLHIGSSTLGEEDTYDYAPSDTLFSALCHAYLAAFGTDELEMLLARFDAGETPFVISSAFPYCGETLFLPVPRIEAPENRQKNGDRKRLKKAAWLTIEDFSRMMSGQEPEGMEDIHKLLPQKELLPRVALDRTDSGSSIYYVRRAVFPNDGGLWTLVDIRDESMAKQLRKTFYLLGDIGLGGERTSGCGFFEPEFSDLPGEMKTLSSGAAPYVAVSRVSPENGEMRLADRFTLVESRGWMSSSTGAQRKRKSVWFFAEGSSFTEKPQGRLIEVTPSGFTDHKVYRYGFGTYFGRPR